MKKIRIIFLCLFVFISCENTKYEEIHVMIENIEDSMSSEDLGKLKNLSENTMNDEFDYSIYYRDNILVSENSKSDVQFFNSLGVDNTNDMTNILFTVLHRKLNDKPLGIENLVKLSVEGKTIFSPPADPSMR